MFDITLITMGKLKEKFYISAAAEYAKRLGGYCRFSLLELPESRLRRLLACIAPAGAKVSPFGLPAFSRGMIATGNHNFERFAALCNTPKVEPRALRAITKPSNCGCFNRQLA